ncbi:MAG: helix-turn-helix transcriptional regulator, partial [Clostridia bacterium]|nr:helix-turn-helix transcriptional regulator [Clostridia bacterium]
MENKFKENLKYLRESNHLGQVELAAKIGVSKGVISLWE